MTVISPLPKPYNDVAAETFGPIKKNVPANDNVPIGNVMNSPLNGGQVFTAVPHGYTVDTAGGIRPSVPQPGPSAYLRGAHDPEYRHGDFMQVHSGRKFWPMDPRADEVFIEDIAHSLSLQCRYAGHCERFYSVAEHSVHLARHLRWQGVEVALWALLHDASESYLVDVPRPVKRHLVGYKEAEERVMSAVCDRFGLAAEMPAVVHEADMRIIADELVNMVPMDWHGKHNNPLGVQIRCWYPAQAEEEFLATFEALMDCRARGME